MQYTIFDIEANGLLEEVTNIHCLSYRKYHLGKLIDKASLTDYKEIKTFLESQECLIGHNIIVYDIPVLEKLLNLSLNKNTFIIDTLTLSWYLYEKRTKHGLEWWGNDLGVEKPKILDWNNLNINDYINRCETDVEINSLLFFKQLDYLNKIYDNNEAQIKSVINYLAFKMDCIKEQEKEGLLIDTNKVKTHLQELEDLKNEKISNLSNVMPTNKKFKTITKPSKCFKKDGSLSATGEKWFKLLEENNLPSNYEGELDILVSEEPGNPLSTKQLKDWLYLLGWNPDIYEERQNKNGEMNKIPQIYENDEVCKSIQNLYTIEPALQNLDLLSKIKHRAGILKSFLEEVDFKTNKVKATMGGFTTTFRLQHRRPIVNLPKVGTFYGEEIRGCIISPPNYLCCGSDCSALEDTTKQHYMYFFDPKYVTEMRTPGFDPHLDVAVLAGLLTPEQAKEHKQGIKSYKTERNLAKVVNFSSVYGAGPPKIASSTGMSLEQAKKLHHTYWDRNKSVKLVSENITIKVFFKNGNIESYLQKDLVNLIRKKLINENDIEQYFLLQPVSKFWYPLRYLKDTFSGLNQGSGVFCFDLWVKEIRSRGIKINLQYHDEILFYLKEGEEENISNILKESMEKVNKIVKLNVPLGCSIDFGKNYADVH